MYKTWRYCRYKKSIEPGSDSYIEEEIPFIRVSDVNKFEIEKTDLHLSPKEFSIEDLIKIQFFFQKMELLVLRINVKKIWTL